MYREHSIGVVVPAYNEEGFVGDVIDTLPEYVDRVYAVDDCSTDGTWAEIQAHADRRNANTEQALADGGVQFDRHVVPIQHEENQGVGGAIKTGYQHARADEVDITTVVGGDGQMDPDMLDRLLDPIVEERAEYVKGNRLIHPEHREEMPTFRLVGNAILSFLTKIASGYWTIGDPQNGYTAISLHALETVEIDEMYEYYGYCNDLLVNLNAAELRVADVPVPSRYADEESHISYLEYIPRVSLMLLSNFLWRLRVKYLTRNFHPLVLLYGIGAAASFVGIFRGLRNVVGVVRRRKHDRESSLPVVLLGTLMLVLAMIFDMVENEELEEREIG
ncbi:glycosyltransferase family 2 protein [Natranaeroarchaeum sulfidigenes]|uniref:Glycosyl transferase family 2 n=1 Tax=Natranaeroarchaeum sulfidigenes TaxID=2784880 RepID=A0A897MRS9_9EURY|nr:glycosyltransferase family 2 protein [Natranaeroarchaeum sulfidigenes]QSG03011.1 Glycosyl transferase family 2 [Natranaeroarchaeum sulfidigenes]